MDDVPIGDLVEAQCVGGEEVAPAEVPGALGVVAEAEDRRGEIDSRPGRVVLAGESLG